MKLKELDEFTMELKKKDYPELNHDIWINPKVYEAIKKKLLADKDEEIEELNVMVIDNANERDKEIDNLNKLWQKKFDWFMSCLNNASRKNKENNVHISIIESLFDEAQNKEFE